MTQFNFTLLGARVLILAQFFFCTLSFGQDAEAPGQPEIHAVTLEGVVQATRHENKNYPVGEAPEVFIANRFGNIDVKTWDNRLVTVTAKITTGAKNLEEANRIAEAITVLSEQKGDRIEARTQAPSGIDHAVDYTVIVPRDTVLFLENAFGDTYVTGSDGALSLKSDYGIVELRDIRGEVNAILKGEFPFVADGLHGGGFFKLRSSQSAFSNVSGGLTIDNYLGTVEVRAPGPQVDMNITSSSGGVTFHLPGGSNPHIEARVDWGNLESDFAMARDTFGNTALGTYANEDATQRFSVHASFENVTVHRTDVGSPRLPAIDRDTELVKEVMEQIFQGGGLDAIHLEAVIGDIRVEGTDEEEVTITAVKYARLKDSENARLALEGLPVRAGVEERELLVRTAVQEDMNALGCTSYRIDLLVRCPRDVPVVIRADSGQTIVEGMTAKVSIEQQDGGVSVEQAAGELELINHKGDIDVIDSSGPLTATNTSGRLAVSALMHDMDLTSNQGKVVVESPRAGVRVRSTGGEVRIIALEGVHGDFDIGAEDGNISLAVPDTADATLYLNARGGAVNSNFKVTGSILKDTHEFQGRIGEGTHRVFLETKQGNIVLD